MSQQEDQVKRSSAQMAPDLESPFMVAELFGEESAPEWEHRLAALQQESPIHDAFATDQNDSSAPMGLEAPYVNESYESVWENGAEQPRFSESDALTGFESTMPWALETGTAANSGLSTLAVPSIKDWGARNNRPEGWQRRVYGLVVHTTGSGVPKKAKREGISPTEWAVRYYKRSRGCHYVNGWRGAQASDLVQVANEDLQAWGVGVTNKDDRSKDQRYSISSGRFEKDLPPILVSLWRKRWPTYKHSLDLLPNTRTANACYVHVECPPCVFHGEKRLETGAEPLRPGLRFTAAQHNTVARLAVDIARRNGWPMNEAWWRTPRLLGHEDLTPITRHDRNGGWDPGYLREKPYFDWDYVYGVIEQILGRSSGASTSGGSTASLSSLFSSLGSLADRFLDFIKRGQEHLALALAYGQGQTDENKLTNLVFFARHPEMGGRRIRAHEKDLAREWLQIRERLVRPFLQSRSREVITLAEMDQALVTEAMQEELELAEVYQDESDEFEDDYYTVVEEEQFAWPADEAAMAPAYDEDEGQWAEEELEEDDWLAEENESDLNSSYAESELLEEAFAEDYSEAEALDEWDEAFLDGFDAEDEEEFLQDESPSSASQPTAELLRFAQRVLNAAEGEKLKVDGIIGKFTRGALARFRSKYRLGAGSALDSATQLVLVQRVLEELAQQSLFAKNGRLDSQTEQAIIDFKARHNLPRSAAIDAQTRSALLAALNGGRGGSATSTPSGGGQVSSAVKTNSGGWGGWKGRATRGTTFIKRSDIADKYDLAVAVAADVETSGAYDKVQMYDRGILSWGIKQWTLHRGSLQKALAYIKNGLAAAGQSSLWNQLFPGIDIRSNKLVVNGTTYDTPQRDGDAADLALRRLFKGSVDPQRYDATRVNRWLERFALAGRHPTIQRLQFAYARNDLKANLNRQLGKILRYRKDIRASEVGNYQRIGDYIEDSPLALVLFNGMETQNPKWTYRYLKRIVDRLSARNGGAYNISRWSANWRVEFAEELQKEFAASGVACWGRQALQTKDSCKKRTSRTDKLLQAYRKFSG